MEKSTEQALQYALVRLKNGRPRVVNKKCKLSIRALAEEAGVSDSTIHNRYPEIAMEVRQLIGHEHKAQRDEKTEMLKTEKTKSRELRAYIEELEMRLRKLASINATLEDENERLKAEIASENVVRIK